MFSLKTYENHNIFIFIFRYYVHLITFFNSITCFLDNFTSYVYKRKNIENNFYFQFILHLTKTKRVEVLELHLYHK